MSKFKKPPAEEVWRPVRLVYGYDGAFEVYAVRPADSTYDEWRMRLHYPTAGVSASGTLQPACWTAETLMDALQRTLRTIKWGNRGEWVLVVRNAEVPPEYSGRGSMAAAEQAIQAGPDTPGRRWLRNHRCRSMADSLKSVPKLEPLRTVATREMIDRLRTPPVPAVVTRVSDEVFFSNLEREPGDDEPEENF